MAIGGEGAPPRFSCRQRSTEMKNISLRLWHEDSGQDVVEYALLAGLIGLGSYAGFVAIQNTIFSSYIRWDTGQQNLWQPPNPL